MALDSGSNPTTPTNNMSSLLLPLLGIDPNDNSAPKRMRDWKEDSYEHLTFDSSGNPTLEVYDFTDGGRRTKLKGIDAVVNARAYAPVRKNLPQSVINAHKFRGYDDYRNSTEFAVGKMLHDLSNRGTTATGGLLQSLGTLGGAAAGTGLGALLMHLLYKYKGIETPYMRPSMYGAIGGGILGGILGNVATSGPTPLDKPQTSQITPALEKRSAMYQNPRNFILEQLQSANDIGSWEKAQLAAKIRAMDTASAEKLKAMVRAALGFGVGALIARFFGAGLTGSLAAGLGLVAAREIMGALTRPSATPNMYRGSEYNHPSLNSFLP